VNARTHMHYGRVRTGECACECMHAYACVFMGMRVCVHIILKRNCDIAASSVVVSALCIDTVIVMSGLTSDMDMYI